jgi:ADP-ribose pyrophosphatase YjhB (NUDIX family)
MTFDYSTLRDLPSPFYRVVVKAIILDGQKRLLVGRGEDGATGWELPGGGFEHDEAMPECVRRELLEELGAEVADIGNVMFFYRGRSKHGWMIVRLAVPVKLKNYDFKFGDMKEAKFVTKSELLNLDFDAEEGTIKDCVHYIWPHN